MYADVVEACQSLMDNGHETSLPVADKKINNESPAIYIDMPTQYLPQPGAICLMAGDLVRHIRILVLSLQV